MGGRERPVDEPPGSCPDAETHNPSERTRDRRRLGREESEKPICGLSTVGKVSPSLTPFFLVPGISTPGRGYETSLVGWFKGEIRDRVDTQISGERDGVGTLSRRYRNLSSRGVRLDPNVVRTVTSSNGRSTQSVGQSQSPIPSRSASPSVVVGGSQVSVRDSVGLPQSISLLSDRTECRRRSGRELETEGVFGNYPGVSSSVFRGSTFVTEGSVCVTPECVRVWTYTNDTLTGGLCVCVATRTDPCVCGPCVHTYE